MIVFIGDDDESLLLAPDAPLDIQVNPNSQLSAAPDMSPMMNEVLSLLLCALVQKEHEDQTDKQVFFIQNLHYSTIIKSCVAISFKS